MEKCGVDAIFVWRGGVGRCEMWSIDAVCCGSSTKKGIRTYFLSVSTLLRAVWLCVYIRHKVCEKCTGYENLTGMHASIHPSIPQPHKRTRDEGRGEGEGQGDGEREEVADGGAEVVGDEVDVDVPPQDVLGEGRLLHDDLGVCVWGGGIG